MITENDVIKWVTVYLTRGNWKILGTSTTPQHGPDIVAKSDTGREIWIEAKGQTSSKEGTRRYGKEFNRSQKEDHLGRALLKCCQYLSERTDLIVAPALPSDLLNSELVRRIQPALQRLKIISFLVNERGGVDVSGDFATMRTVLN